jgi:uncharacterized protein HemX
MDDSPNQPPLAEKSQSSIGPMVAIIIVVILLAIGGVYFFIQQEIKLHQQPINEQISA